MCLHKRSPRSGSAFAIIILIFLFSSDYFKYFMAFKLFKYNMIITEQSFWYI